MKLSEMIKKLQEVIDEHGDFDTHNELEVEPVEVYDPKVDDCRIGLVKVHLY